MYATSAVEMGPVIAVIAGALLCSVGLRYLKIKRWYIHGIFGGVVSLYGALLVQAIVQAEVAPFDMMELYLASGVFGAISFCVVYLVRNIHIGLAAFILTATAAGVFVASNYQPGVIGETVVIKKIARSETSSPRDVYIPPTDSQWTQAGYLSRSYDDEYKVTPPIGQSQSDFHWISHVSMHNVITEPAVRDGKCVRVTEKYYDKWRPKEESPRHYICQQIYTDNETDIYVEKLTLDDPFRPDGDRKYYTVMPNEILLEVYPRNDGTNDTRMIDFIKSLRLATLDEKIQLAKNENDRYNK